MDRATLDAAYNNSAAVKNSAQIVAGWQQRSARVRRNIPMALDLRWPRSTTQPHRLLRGEKGFAPAGVHPWRLLADAREGDLHRSSCQARSRTASASRWSATRYAPGSAWTPSSARSAPRSLISIQDANRADRLRLVRGRQHLAAMAMQMPAVNAGHGDQRSLRPGADSTLLRQRQAAPRRPRGASRSSPVSMPAFSEPMTIAYGRKELPSCAGSPRSTRRRCRRRSCSRCRTTITSRSWKSSPRPTAR